MTDSFDPYRKWLGIPANEQPPNHYRLLGIGLFENDSDVIQEAADRQMAHVQTHRTGKYSDLSQKLLNELSTARLCLLDARKKNAYDQALRAKQEPVVLQATVLPTESPAPIQQTEQGGGNVLVVAAIGGAAVIVLAIVAAVAWLGGGDPPLADQRRPESVPAKSADTDAGPKVSPPDPRPKDSEDPAKLVKQPAPTVEVRRPTPPPEVIERPSAPPETPEKPVEPKKPEPPKEPVDKPIEKPLEKPVPEIGEVEKPTPKPTPVPVPAPTPIPPPAPAVPPGTKTPVPSASEQAAAEKDVREAFNFAGAKTPAEKADLAGKLTASAQETKDSPAARYVQLREARDLAVGAGHFQRALDAVERMAGEFDVDRLALKAEVVRKVRLPNNLVDENRQLMESAIELMEQSVDEDRFELALAFQQVASATARRFKANEVVRDLTDRVKEIRRKEDDFKALEKALATIEQTPDDGGANLAVGQYYCQVKGDWARGLPYLARSNNAELAALAARDLAVKDQDDMLAVADLWYARAEKTKPAAANLLRRAAHWYSEAEPKLSGLEKAKAGNRLLSIGPLDLIGQPDFMREDLALFVNFDRKHYALEADRVLAKDISASRNHVRLTGARSLPTEEYLRELASLSNAPLSGKVPMTVALWANASSLAGASRWGRGLMRSTHGEIAGDWQLSVTDQGKLRFAYFAESGMEQNAGHTSSASVVRPGEWYHLAASWDGAAAHLYVNGLEVPYSNDGASRGWGTGHEIGRIYGGEGYQWNGKIDNVCLFKRALPLKEIAALARIRPSGH